MVQTPYPLEGLELATAIVYGPDPTCHPLPLDDVPAPPRDVLEKSLTRALLKPPCVVSFSGGRDSSAILALAARLAREHGLPAPIAVTNVIPGDEDATEDEWQEAVIRHLGLEDWERVRFTDEMDVVGPIAAPLLERFGPYFPFNGHFLVPGMKLARGGTFLSGVGGDELFDPGESDRLSLIFTGKLRPNRRDLRTLIRRLQPLSFRVRRLAGYMEEEPWLQPDVGQAFVHDLAEAMATQHLWYSDQLRWDIWPDRGREAQERTLRAFAGVWETSNVQPFLEPELMSSLVHHKGRAAWGSRTAAMDALFGDVLPPEVLRRSSKASFDSVFFNVHSRATTERWTGDGVDERLVDPEKLRLTWEDAEVDARSLSLLQSIWLQAHRPV